MVVDASAIVAILLDEPEAAMFELRLLAARRSLISPVNHWEVLARAYSKGGAGARQDAEDLMTNYGVEVSQADAALSRAAADAFARFGRPMPAGLNLGDCFAYALAQSEGDGLLYKGEDFARTDVVSALDLEP